MLRDRLKRFVKRLLGRPAVAHANVVFWPGGTPPARLNQTQAWFCDWNAERLGISVEDSRRRYAESWQALRGGHGGPEFRGYCVLSHTLFRVFYDDNPGEVFAAYRFHGPMHFLRMLSYAEPDWADDDPVVAHLRTCPDPSILDFGCGLAQRSRGLALKLQADGQTVGLDLVDIPTERKAFLLWLGGRLGIPTTFADCTPEAPIPPLGPCDACIATEVFEHLHAPLAYLEAMHAALRPGGLLVTNIADQKPEYMHVSPDLSGLRARLAELGYAELTPTRLYRKPSQAQPTDPAPGLRIDRPGPSRPA